EAHHISDGFLRDSPKYRDKALLYCARLATTLLWCPIAGLTACFFMAGTLIYLADQITWIRPDDTNRMLILLLIGVVIGAFSAAWYWRPRSVCWSDLSISIALCAAGVIGFIAWRGTEGLVQRLQTPADCFAYYYDALRYVWIPWCAVV